MYSLLVKKIQQSAIALALLLPAAGHPQSLGSLLSTLKQVTSSDTLDARKSVAEVIQAQLPPGASAQNAEGGLVSYILVRR